MHVFWKVKTLYQPAVFLSNGTADWIHRPSAIQRARAAARRDPPDRLVPRPPNDRHPVPPSRTQRAFLFKTFGRAPVHFLPHTLSLGLALSLYLPRSHIHPEILSDFGPIAPPVRGRPAIESSGDRTQVSISSSALASLDPHDFDQVFLIFFALLFIEVIDTEHLKSRTAGGVLESQILGR